MNVIIIGAGLVGSSLAEELSEDNNVMVIDTDYAVCNKLDNRLDVRVINGNGANIAVLNEAGVNDADFVICTTNNDELNILSSIIAKSCGAKKTIARVRNIDYTSSFINKRKNIGIDSIINPEIIIAYKIIQLLFIPSSKNFTLLASGLIGFFEITLSEDNDFVGKTIKDCDFPKYTIIATIGRKDQIMVPSGDDILYQGDKLILIGTRDNIFEVIKNMGLFDLKKILVIGGGTVGFCLAKYLEESHIDVKLIEKDEKRCELIASELNNTLILNGDGTDLDLLKRENASDFDVVVSVTDNDETNLISSLLVKKMGATKAIARANKYSYTNLYETLGIDFDVNFKLETMRAIKFCMTTDFNSIVDIDGKVKVIDFTANETMPIVKDTLRNLILPKRMIVGAIIRDGRVIIPRGGDKVNAGDEVIIFVNIDEFEQVKKFIKG